MTRAAHMKLHQTGESNTMYGKPSWNKGKTGVYSEESRKKMSDAKQNFTPWNAGKKCPQLSGSHNGMYDVHRNGKDHPRSKPVKCITNGITYECIKYAILDTGVFYYAIKRSCNEGIPYKGFMFEWAK